MAVLTGEKPAAKAPETKPAPAADDKSKPAEKPAAGAKGDDKPKGEEKPKAEETPAYEAPATAEALQTLIDAALETERGKFAAPEKYTLELPKDSVWTKEELGVIEGEAKLLGLTQEQAAKLFDTRHAQVDALADADYEALAADKKLGGDNLEKTQTTALKGMEWGKARMSKAAIAQMDSDLKRTGTGSRLWLVELFNAIGLGTSEDNPATLAGGAGDAGAKRDPVDVLYGKQ